MIWSGEFEFKIGCETVQSRRTVASAGFAATRIYEVSLSKCLPPEVRRVDSLSTHGLMHRSQLAKGEFGSEEAMCDRRVLGFHSQASQRVRDDIAMVKGELGQPIG